MAHLTPAQCVIRTFGGVAATARAVGRDQSSVSKWSWSREKGGCDGGIPRTLQQRILEIADEQGLDLTPADLIYGRTIPTDAENSSQSPEAVA